MRPSPPSESRGPDGAFPMHAYRTHTCGALRLDDSGKTQLVFSPQSPAFPAAERLRAESVIRIDGEVVARSAETVNANLPTGEIEISVREVAVLSEASELPLPVFG